MQKNMLKIGFVLDDGLDRPDGVQQHILTLGNWLKDQGHEVHYLVGETNRTDIDNVHSLARNIKVHFNGNRLTIPLPSSRRKIKKVLTDCKFDILHVQVPYSPFFGAQVVSLAHKNTVVMGTFHILPYGWLARIGTRLLGILLSVNIKRFDRHLAVSSVAAEFAKKTFKIDCDVVPNPVDTSKYKPTKTSNHTNNPTQLVFVGRLVERKGCFELLQALSKLTVHSDWQLDICGAGHMQTVLETYVRANNLENKVVFHGFVSEEDKIRYLRQADLAIFPALSGESFGIVLIEAMAAGSGVVLGGNNPGYSGVLNSVPKSLFNPRDISAFSLYLKTMIEDKGLRDRLHNSQQQLVKQFDVSVVGEKLLNIYIDCINYRIN
jgi:phosphatidylinositol alpha-mannosyltransferase